MVPISGIVTTDTPSSVFSTVMSSSRTRTANVALRSNVSGSTAGVAIGIAVGANVSKVVMLPGGIPVGSVSVRTLVNGSVVSKAALALLAELIEASWVCLIVPGSPGCVEPGNRGDGTEIKLVSDIIAESPLKNPVAVVMALARGTVAVKTVEEGRPMGFMLSIVSLTAMSVSGVLVGDTSSTPVIKL